MSVLQSDLDTISSWLSSHFLHLNSSKSMYIFFSHKPASHFDSFPPLPNLRLNVSLPTVVSASYLHPPSPGLRGHTSKLPVVKPVKYLALFSTLPSSLLPSYHQCFPCLSTPGILFSSMGSFLHFSLSLSRVCPTFRPKTSL